MEDDNQEQTLTKSPVDTEGEEAREENKDSEKESSGFKHRSRQLDSDDESGD